MIPARTLLIASLIVAAACLAGLLNAQYEANRDPGKVVEIKVE